MSTIKVNAIQHTTANASNMTLFANGNVAMTTANTTLTVGNTTISNSGISVGGAAINPLATGMRNRIINGDMRIDQRNAGVSANVNGNDIYTVDRWKGWASGGGIFSAQQSSVAPAGFRNSVVLTVTSADSSIGAGDNYRFAQPIEGFNVADLGFGTSDAKNVTVSFWVRSNLTGTYGGALYSVSGTRSYVYQYTINAANTWEYKTITIPGDTSGTWGTTNSFGITVYFDLGSGSNYQNAIGSWVGSEKFSTSGNANWIGTLSNNLYITGVQFEAGTVATPFEFRHYGQELALCQRYYYRVSSGGVAYAGFAIGRAYSTTAGSAILHLPVSMRSAPILGTSSLSSGNFDYGVTNLSLGCDTSNRIVTLTTTTLSVSQSQSSWQLGAGNVTSNVYLEFSSEL